MRRELMDVVKRTEGVLQDWRMKVQSVRRELEGVRKELKFVGEKYALLKVAEQDRHLE